MKEIPIIAENACGYKLTGNVYLADVPTKKWLICLHGIGEKGPLDGSNLDDLEIHGYPKHIANGLKLPFNVLAPQISGSYSQMMYVLIPHLILKYEADAIVQTGLSLGGMATWDMLWKDTYKKLKAIVPVCGKPTIKDKSGLIDFSTINHTPVLTVHGMKDNKVGFVHGQKASDMINLIHPGQSKMIRLSDVAHNAWDKAYNINDPVGKEVFDFIVYYLNKDNSSDEYARGYSECKEKAITVLNSL